MISSELTGGAGFTFEDAVAAVYLAALVNGTTTAGLTPRVVHRVALQQAPFGEPLDDVIVDAVSVSDHSVVRLSLQVKRALTISDAATNTDFREVIQRSWETLQKADFRDHLDRVGAVTGTIAEEPFRAFVTVCEWARASQTTASFMQRFADGNASRAHRGVLDTVRKLVQEGSGESSGDDALHRLFRHLVLIKLDLLHQGAAADAEVVASLQRSLVASQTERADDLWRQLRQLARDGSGRSEEFTRGSVLQRLSGDLRFVGSPSFAHDLAVLREMTQHWLAQQANDIGGTHIDRPALQAQLNAEMAGHRFTLIKGLPGTGKTAVLHDLLTRSAVDGTTLFLGANRLSGRSWAEFSRAVGLSSAAIERLLVEIAATGHAVLFIDGLDRIAPEQRTVVTDLLGQILSSPVLAQWRTVATARDAGIEPLRNWLPSALLANGGVGYVDVPNLDDDEAATLARAVPALRPLLLGGDERVRSLARRPFFAAVLARGFSNTAYPVNFAPRSEVDLIEAWWTRGGYDAQSPQALARQLALIELACQSAPDLGRNLHLRSLSPATQATFPVLEQDGLVQQVRRGHSAQFAHDIFFEWSFFHWLVDQGDGWVQALIQAGEPPALARVVELLSQAIYPDASAWQRNLQALQGAPVRPQWLRAWLLAPLFSPHFIEQVDAYTATVAAEDHRLLTKLLVWMQAEKTIPNPLVLSGQLGAPDLEASERIRLADALGWPSDGISWGRLLHWALDRVATFPDRCLGDLVTLFETWQVAFADIPNPVSERVVQQCAIWLHAIEDGHQATRRWRFGEHPVEPAAQVRTPTQSENELRALVLRAARAYPAIVTAYLSKIGQIDRLPESAFHDVMSYAPLLAQTHAELLAQVARTSFLEELPDDAATRWRQEAVQGGRRREELLAIPEEQRTGRQELALASPRSADSFSHHNWHRLSIGADHRGYFPASPLREPFHSLLGGAPGVGLALVRDLANHAITAWRQLHRHMPRRGTPLPLTLDFPWGPQEFWGTAREYVWFRGWQGGPKAVECALMALERWALDELKAGKAAGDVLQQLLQGHSSIAVLGIAVLIALHAREVSPVTLPLVSNQRLWRADLERYVKESSFRSAGLIGFDPTQTDMAHRKAVEDAAALPARGLEIRALVTLFALTADKELRAACRSAIERFPQELGFEYEEEAADADHVAKLRRTAELWSEWGRTENYVAAPIPGRDDLVSIELRSPRHSDPEVLQAQQRHVQTSQEFELWLWVERCFETKSWAAGFTVDEAAARATAVASVVADGGSTFLPGNDIAHGAIAGTAAAICCFTEDTSHQAWTDQTLATYRDEVEPQAPDVFSKSLIPWHPKIFVARALAARIRTDHGQERYREDLYQLVVHPLEVVSLTAISGIASCWDRDPRFAWCGLNLGLRVAQYTRPEDYNPASRAQAEQAHRAKALADTLVQYRAGGDFPEWVRPLPAWTEVPPHRRRGRAVSDDDTWYRSDHIWIGDYAAEVLHQVPVAKVMASPARDRYVQALEAFVTWTLDTVNPAWQTERRRGREREGADLFEWQHELGRILAVAAEHLPSEMQARLLNPIIDQPDDICMPILAPFTDLFVCISILDAPQIEERGLVLLDACLERTLQHADFRRTGYRAGQIGGFDLPVLIKALLFVAIERADGAARFANGRWEDLSRVLPLIDKMVRRIGWAPFVMRQFITLCERAGANYPADAFAGSPRSDRGRATARGLEWYQYSRWYRRPRAGVRGSPPSAAHGVSPQTLAGS
jgi:SpoVK/Ycf46/Vps4 family AAA+-type ATPase